MSIVQQWDDSNSPCLVAVHGSCPKNVCPGMILKLLASGGKTIMNKIYLII